MTRRYFGSEFKRAAVSRVVGGRTAAAVAHELGIRPDQLRRWKHQLTLPHLDSVRREELKRIRRSISNLRAELGLLERAAAILGMGSRRT